MSRQASVLEYTFAVAKIRSLEQFLVKEGVFQEVLEADLSEALRLFVESGLYSDELLRVKESQGLEAVLDSELEKLKRLMRDLVLDADLMGLVELSSAACVGEIIKNYKSEFLENYIRHLLDMHNIKTYLRLYILKEPQEQLQAHLAYEGFIKKEDLLHLYSQDLPFFINRLSYVHTHNQIIDYGFYLGDAIRQVEAKKSFVVLEKSINDFLIQVLKPAKYIVFGPEPLLAYYFAKINEINLIRMIILAKLNNALDDLVKERLNSVYA